MTTPKNLISESIIQSKLASDEVDFTVHSVFEAAADLVFVDEIEKALATAEIVEDEVDRCRCVLLAKLRAGDPLHIVVEYADWIADPASHLVIVTVYRPNPAQWIDGRIRRY